VGHWQIQPAGQPARLHIRTLLELLGPTLTAVVLGASSTAQLLSWARGTRIPRTATRRAAIALDIARTAARDTDSATLRAWFRGKNPGLGDVSPARAILTGLPLSNATAPP